MKISIVLDTKRELANGKYPIKIKLYDRGKEIFIKTDYSCNTKNFDKDNEIIFGLSGQHKSEMIEANTKLLSMLNEIKILYTDLERKGQLITPSRIKELYLKGDTRKDITLNECFSQFISKKKGRTAEIYQTTLDKIEKYNGKTIYFDDVSHSWLESFDSKLAKEPIKNRKGETLRIGLEVNARSIHFRNIRAVFNYAIDNEYISQNTYPFRRFKIKKEDTIKRAIKVDILRTIFNFEGSNQQNWSIDVAKIIFFLIGINIKDLYNLSELSEESTIYKRAKTSRVYNIWIEPELRILLDKYKSEDGLVFKDQFKMYQSFNKKVNKYLLEVCNELKAPKITTYSLRHSWATIAGNLDIPDKTIKMALGHGKRTTTDIYIDFDMEKVKKANRKVIDYIFQRGEYAPKEEQKKEA